MNFITAEAYENAEVHTIVVQILFLGKNERCTIETGCKKYVTSS